MSIHDGKWWDQSWNPIHVKGGGWYCHAVSSGCEHCWAESFNKRYGNKLPFRSILGRKIEFEFDQRILEQPLHWKKPRIVAVQWLGDLFHEQIDYDLINSLWNIIIQADWHKYLILTKRPQRMNEFFLETSHAVGGDISVPWVWLGVSISTQKEADEKITILLQTPAIHHFVNLGPMLEAINIKPYLRPGQQFFDALTSVCSGILNENLPNVKYDRNPDGLDWVCLECESGLGRRPMKLEWARNIAEQCRVAGVPLWIKQLDIDGKVSKDMTEWPDDLRKRQSPLNLVGWR